MKPTLIPGLTHELKFRVPESKMVPALYPEAPAFQLMPRVFATGFMVGLLEWACIETINPHLDWPREQTLGTHIDVSHLAATPPGFEVNVKVRITDVQGKRLRFEVEAHDGVDQIAKGTHERYVVDKARFVERIEMKAARREE